MQGRGAVTFHGKAGSCHLPPRPSLPLQVPPLGQAWCQQRGDLRGPGRAWGSAWTWSAATWRRGEDAGPQNDGKPGTADWMGVGGAEWRSSGGLRSRSRGGLSSGLHCGNVRWVVEAGGCNQTLLGTGGLVWSRKYGSVSFVVTAMLHP